MPLIILLLLFIYKVYIYICCKYLELYTYPVLRDGIKLFAVATRDQKFFDVPRLDFKGGQVYNKILFSI